MRLVDFDASVAGADASIFSAAFSCNPKHRISAHNTAPDGLAFLNPSPVVSPKFKLDMNGSPSSAHQRRTRGLLMHCCDCFYPSERGAKLG
ncbi:hypothetical protein CDAR_468371 [Caerostris darwini]|uniref:Uncharacterized protein n=1 Tax=Caerostris darwini TaxID=1538125 RepID=A0AAV4WXS6_9ARAC|nr:hypothetical protein CDAR_468371 [Caerostris darwini]